MNQRSQVPRNQNLRNNKLGAVACISLDDVMPLKNQGWKNVQIAHKFGVHEATVSKLLSRKQVTGFKIKPLQSFTGTAILPEHCDFLTEGLE